MTEFAPPISAEALDSRDDFLRRALEELRALSRGATKRAIDVVGSAALVVLLAPLFAVLWLAVRLTSPGPVFFRQQRVGLDGATFTMWKFRSMYPDAEARRVEVEARNEMAGGVLFKMSDDPRITPVGRILRRTSLDELPQLWNVLLGDMSLVGPRPCLPSECAQYSARHRRRLEARPGITCLWQVMGRSEIPFERQVELDVEYIQTQSLWLDIRILLLTIPAVVRGQGAL
jgi:exopolysaccharide biosynthesis polyprenyl glycosylphosphotransferase